MADLELTYAEINRILEDDWYDDRFKIVRMKGPHSDGGFRGEYCTCKFKDTVTGKTYSFDYLYYEHGITFPEAFEVRPKGITFVETSSLVQWLTPGEFPARKDCTPEQKEDMDLWKAYKAQEKKKKLRPDWRDEARLNEVLKPMKAKLVRFMKTKKASDMANVRAVLLPLAIEHGFHHKAIWMGVQQLCGNWRKNINCEEE